MRFKDIIAQRVTDYYAANGPIATQIAHTIIVAGYTTLLANQMGKSEHEKDLLEAAAWLHDIGCPEAIRKHGDSRPVHQQEEGERIVKEWLSGADGYTQWNHVTNALTGEEKEWLAHVVGTHHQKAQAEALHFEPLFEADLIVNIQEGYYGRSQAQHLFETMMITDAGRQLFRRIVYNKKCSRLKPKEQV